MSVASITAPLRGGSWAGSAPRSAGNDSCASIPGIAGWALEYIQPLQQWWDDLLGDPAGTAGVAASWEDVERTLRGVSDELAQARGGVDALEGRTIRLLEQRYDDLIPIARDAADWSGAVAAGTRLASRVVVAVRTFICDFLVQLSDLTDALFGFTLNPFDKIDQLNELVDAAWDLIQSGGRLIQQMFDAFEQLINLVGSLGPVIAEAQAAINDALSRMVPYAAAGLFSILGAGVGFALGGPLGALGGTAAGGGLGFMLGGARGDMMRDGADVSRYDIDDLRAEYARNPTDALADKISAWDTAHGVESLDSLADLVAVNGTTDAMGAADSTAIDVKLVRAADGTEHWVVSLPSTQQWDDVSGSGAMNDRDTNLALMMMQGDSQYERAVMRAMEEAGMAPGDPVVFTGFSQGGIMAAHLASDAALPYRPIGVVTNGSPVDTFNVPRDVPVISFQHTSDAVPMLDGNIYGNTNPNVTRVVLPDDAGHANPVDAHNNTNYVESIRDHASGIASEYAWMGGEVIDHQVFVSHQR